MIGALAGAALGVGSSIFGAIQSSKSAKKAKKMTERQLAENENWYTKRANEDYLQRADSQRAINFAKKQAQDYSKKVAGQAAVTGATEASKAIAKKAGTEMIGDVVGDVAVQGAKAKEDVENTYIARKDALTGNLQNIENQKAQSISDAVGGAVKAGTSIIGADSGGLFGKYKAAKATA